MALFGPPNIDKLKAKHKVKGWIKALAYKKDPTIRKEAAQALGQIGDVRAVGPLVDVIKTDKVSWVCKAAIEALAKLDWQPDTDEAGAFYWVGKEQWDRCVKIGAPAVVPLIAALEGRVNNRYGVCKAAAKALGRIGDARAVEPLIAAFMNKLLTENAIETLVKIGAPAVEPLIAALKDENWRTRWAAAKTLGQIGAPAVEAIIAALRDSNRTVREAADSALRQICDIRAAKPLIAALKDGDLTARRAAAKTLGLLGDTLAIDPLIVALKDADRIVRKAAAKALGQLSDTRSAEPLIAAFQDKDASVCGAVVRALHRIGWEPKGDAEKAAHWIIKGELNRLSELNYQTIKEILIKSSNWGLDWQINGQIAVLLVQHDMKVSDPRLLQTIQELKAWASKSDQKRKELEAGDQDMYSVEVTTRSYIQERATATAYLKKLRLV